MAVTTVATGDAITVKAYAEKIFRETLKQSYFSRFMGSGSDACVQVDTRLEKEAGDRITFPLRYRLQGSGVTGSGTLENNEEALDTASFNVTLEEYAHAVRVRQGLDVQRPAFDLNSEASMAIKDWGTEKIDQLCFDAIGIGDGATTDPTKIFYPNSSGVFTGTGSAATAKAGLHATNSLISPAFVEALKTWAMTGGDRAQIPLRPIKVGGKKYYILLVHPDCLYDLRTNSTYLAFLREAEVRGSENPIFAGAEAIINGVVIHAHENVATFTNGGGASVAGAKCALLGAQALVWAWGRRPKLVEKSFDYDRQKGVAWSMIAGVSKTQFDSKDFGLLGVYLARTNVSGA